MTALMDPALARLSASHMINSSIKWSFTGGEVDWMIKTSRPRTFSPISTWISPSENRVTSALESGRFKYSQIRRASAGLEFPANTLKSWVNMAADQLRAPGAICLLPLGHLRLLMRRRGGGEVLLSLVFQQNHLFHSDSGDGVQGVGDVLVGAILAPLCRHRDEKPCASSDHFGM